MVLFFIQKFTDEDGHLNRNTVFYTQIYTDFIDAFMQNINQFVIFRKEEVMLQNPSALLEIIESI